MVDTKADWWKEAVIYQIYPRSFCDASGDGVGDLTGITGKLDYVASLGVDGIWISPFFTSPMNDYGYDVSDYTGVDPLFGTLDDFDVLMARAKALGLKVIIDQVLSHSSDEHAWFQESASSRDNPKADWYVWADAKPDGSPPNNWLSIFGGCGWEWSARRQQYYLHNFLTSQPDLNFHCAAMQDALLETSRFWLERGVDGFRLDVCNFFYHDKALRDNPAKEENDRARGRTSPYDMQQHLYDKSQPEATQFHRKLRALTNEYGATMMVGEVGDDDPLKIMDEYTCEPDLLHTCYSFALLRHGTRTRHVAPVVQEFFGRSPGGWPSWSFSNHDVVRAVSRFAGSAAGEEASDALAAALNALLLALPGTLFMYQGEELGLGEALVAGDDVRDPVGRDGCRTPMVWQAAGKHAGFGEGKPWLPVSPQHKVRAVDAQEGVAASVLEQTRALIKWRRQQPALLRGGFAFHDVPEGCIALSRESEGQRLLIVVNTRDEAAAFALDVPGRATLALGNGCQINGQGNVLAGPFGYGYFEIT